MTKLEELSIILNFELGFQDPATGLGQALTYLYNVVSVFLVFVFTVILYLFIIFLVEYTYDGKVVNDVTTYEGVFNNVFKNILNVNNLTSVYTGKKRYNFLKVYDISEYHTLEKTWTFFPAFILVSIITPSFSVAYWVDPKTNPFMVVKIIGNQWYWSYECSVDCGSVVLSDSDLFKSTEIYKIFVRSLAGRGDIMGCYEKLKALKRLEPITYSFDMNLVDIDFEKELKNLDLPRLLNVDNRLIVPVGVPIRFLVTASDVLHCWALPSLGIKIDAVPGRLSSFTLFIDRPGIFYGQCSEICGPMHGFMPIVVEAVPMKSFQSYLALWVDTEAAYREFKEADTAYWNLIDYYAYERRRWSSSEVEVVARETPKTIILPTDLSEAEYRYWANRVHIMSIADKFWALDLTLLPVREEDLDLYTRRYIILTWRILYYWWWRPVK